MKDKDFEKLLKEREYVVIPTDGVFDMWQDEIGLVRMTVGIGKSSQESGNMLFFIDNTTFHRTDEFDKYMAEAEKATKDGLFNDRFKNENDSH